MGFANKDDIGGNKVFYSSQNLIRMLHIRCSGLPSIHPPSPHAVPFFVPDFEKFRAKSKALWVVAGRAVTRLKSKTAFFCPKQPKNGKITGETK